MDVLAVEANVQGLIFHSPGLVEVGGFFRYSAL
jgi:hypothetical protein